ncbi:ATP-dependent metallopeptidase FtsH/Yme1/Tma family protein [Pseudoxanthomonas winnipegensis]|uniref:ATP-dependent zinc metalloprotease FtsH n=2 Tax=Pseudoxanthomonas winnipegensis TaxID=2480810 RepID=A0A4Q9TF29_9GAMM|nr:ATP-dependent metallopeptidase FtsH/Yme1/Tma family protein [Pseudoxanthomonas winnipegensis]RZZ86820.1 ATP-dependent metallopeptidase FtsH/Yme1/Tma family protein [Pseudoxanthomonas winnipegensis]TAA07983.1 ATP-dependent metallopeptidase FtsH/Yme1/Tma family protein [Pseudoxanthomonas winnipegensis]TAA20975.1 ATP-dependent metallopeptidase FtsH/Yme1/Tma family protein [Pseudoxanthomonas winnipegensis]TAA25004.1 ATP-dependent metallopeptidase FtsH/Yme1/Tma family protein [Pseudoxanthomonas w
MRMNDLTKNLLLWVVVAVVLMVVFQSFSPRPGAGPGSNQLTYTQFVNDVNNGQISSVEFTNKGDQKTNAISYKRTDGTQGLVFGPTDESLVNVLIAKGVNISQQEPDSGISLAAILLNFLPVLLIIGFWIFIMRQMQGGGGGAKGAMSFGKSRAKLQGEDQVKVTFADVAGCDEAKEEVGELVEFLRDPTKFQKVGGKIPRGVLMVGQPGTGKTLLAKAIAGEAKVPFFSISGSDFVEMFVGVGASRVRDMFEQAKKHAPCIIFIDEIDAVGRHRGAGLGGGHDEREQTLNQLLVEMDGFEGGEGVIIIAATNRPDVLDPALLRPGRFDRQVVVGLPDVKGREQILKVHMRKLPLADDVDAMIVARGTPGFSGADLANLCNEAALFAARGNEKEVRMDHFDRARDKILMGAERRSMAMSEDEKTLTAYHEAGHAIVGRVVPEHDPVYKVTIIPRGRALGVTMYLPEGDKYSYNRTAIESQLCSLYGGRVAEELIFGTDKVTTGASNDIERATKMARNMVTKWGLSDEMGPIAYGEEEDEVFLGRSVTQHKNVSDATARKIDEVVRGILDNAYQRTTKILTDNLDKLHTMAKLLLQYETIDAPQIDAIMEGRDPPPPAGWSKTNNDNNDRGGGSKRPLPPIAGPAAQT